MTLPSRFLAAAVSRQCEASVSSRSMESSMSSDALTYGACTPPTLNHPSAEPLPNDAQSRKTSCMVSIAELSSSVTRPSFIMYPSPRFNAACISIGETSCPIASKEYLTSNAPLAASRICTTGTTDGMVSVSAISRSESSTRQPLRLRKGSPAPRKFSTFCGSVT